MSKRLEGFCRAGVGMFFGLAVALALPTPLYAQVRVIISGGFAPAYREVIPEFERTTGISVSTASGASQGTGPDTIGAMLGRGERADVVILNRSGLADLQAQGRIVTGTDRDLAQTPTGVAVRAGAPRPDLRTVEGLKQALLQAGTIATPGSSAAVTANVLSRLGIARDVTVKTPGRGTESVAMVARGEAVLSIQPVSEILNVPGVELAGTLPTELQFVTVYAAAFVVGTDQSEPAQRLITFLSSPAVAAAVRKSGLEPSPGR